ncbi:bifunctional diguanylate cyclase/phosphodiesterase [Rheinheimera gaetbuli]
MKIAHNVKLLRLLNIVPPLLVTAFAVMFIFIVVDNNQIKLENDLKTLRDDFISSRKSMVKAQVEQLVQQIDYEKSRTEFILKEDIKHQIYNAHAIAMNIFNENSDKSEQVVTKLIKSALRDIRFNNGRGYFFIYKTNGESIMHPVIPSMEGTQQIGLQDVRGNYIVRDMGSLAKNNGETYYTWWFVKPENKDVEFKKIGFGKHFEPYDWFIGTGEYIVDVENDIKNTVIDNISNIRFGEHGYAFLFDYNGIVLAHFDENFQDGDLYNHKDPLIREAGITIISTAQQGGGFVSYSKPSTSKSENKTSFIRGIPEWEWALGMGFYESEIEAPLNKRESEMLQENRQQLIELLWLSVLVAMSFIIISLYFTKRLSKSFMDYEEKINNDFYELNKVKVQMQYQALHDSLTRLPNRVLLEDHIFQGINLSRKNNSLLAVIFVDLDDFKKINDSYGHSIGDQFLKRMGELFHKVKSEKDSVARFGGDEFIFCCPDIADLGEAENKVREILSIFQQKFEVAGKSFYSTCSIGVSVYPKDGTEAEQLISKADIALYKSKSTAKGRSLFFNGRVDEAVKRSFAIETELRTALLNEEISILYQPQICVKTGNIVGVEALARWHSKKLGFVSPAEFIPIAENSGTINELGDYVIYKALFDINAFNINNAFKLNLSINISPKQLLEPNFVESVVQASDDIAFDRQFITLEITENVLITDLSVVLPILLALRENNFKLSLDDFGTGYSSLSYLSNLPINEIKIDRTFIDKFLTNHQSESLVKTIIAIGDFCDFTVVAEGVETKAQLERLRQFNCDLIQGYYFDKPLAYTDLVAKYQSCNVRCD